MSNHTRQGFPLFQIECRVIIDSAFRCSRSNVESHSTAHSAVPGRMSSQLDSAFCCSRLNVDSQSTALSALRVRMSSQIRQRFPTYQVECRIIFDSALRLSMKNVKSHSTELLSQVECRVTTACSVIPERMSSNNRHRFPLFQVEFCHTW